jgi:hypothetical protein
MRAAGELMAEGTSGRHIEELDWRKGSIHPKAVEDARSRRPSPQLKAS